MTPPTEASYRSVAPDRAAVDSSLCAVDRDQVLVGGHDGETALERALDGRQRSVGAPHQLDEEIDVLGGGHSHRVAADRGAAQIGLPAFLGIGHGHARDPKRRAHGALDVARPLVEQVKEPGADDAAADQSEPDGGWHGSVQPTGGWRECQTRATRGGRSTVGEWGPTSRETP